MEPCGVNGNAVWGSIQGLTVEVTYGSVPKLVCSKRVGRVGDKAILLCAEPHT